MILGFFHIQPSTSARVMTGLGYVNGEANQI
jgi:hypothetical protein